MQTQRQIIINQLVNEYSKPYNQELQLLRRIDQARPAERKPTKKDLK